MEKVAAVLVKVMGRRTTRECMKYNARFNQNIFVDAPIAVLLLTAILTVTVWYRIV